MTSDEREMWWLSSTDPATDETLGGAVLGGVHPASACAGHHCCLHNPSDHPLKHAPLRWRGDRRIMERVCEHGIGHDDPDDLAYCRSVGAEGTGAHGCCA